MSTDESEGKPTGRFRTAQAWDKSLGQYEELLRSGKIKRALVIAEDSDEKYTILAQMTTPAGAAELVILAARALEQVPGMSFSPAKEPLPRKAAPFVPASKAPHTLAAEWSRFEANVLGPTVGRTQRREMRRAFYAGMGQLIFMMQRMFDPGETITADDMAKLQVLLGEIEDFGSDIANGRA